jgi:uncharacterized repeat protein (TIGR01451 family)
MASRRVRQVVRGIGCLAMFAAGLAAAGVATGGGPILLVSKSHSPGTVNVGDPLTYQVGVTNAVGTGGSTVQDVTITDTLPPEVVFSSADAGCSYSGVVTCTIGTLFPGAGATRSIVVTPTVAGTITNSANAS